MKKRFAAILLSLSLAVTLLPATVSAADTFTLAAADQKAIPGIEMASAMIGQDVIMSGETREVEPGSRVVLTCHPADGYLFKGWTLEPEGVVSAEALCETFFNMPESDVTVSANVEKLTPDFQLRDGVATWNAVEGYQSKLVIDPAPNNMRVTYLDAENGSYTADIQESFKRIEYTRLVLFGQTDTSDMTGTYSLGLSYAKDGEEQGMVANTGATFSYEAGQLEELGTAGNLRWDGFTARWDGVENAGSYRVTITETVNGTSQTYGKVFVTDTSCDLTSVSGRTPAEGAVYTFSVKAFGAEDTCDYLPGAESQSSPESEGYRVPIEDYHLVVAGVTVTSGNAGDILDDGKVSYDPASKTLTLENAALNDGIYRTDEGADEPLTIEVAGKNTIDHVNSDGIALGNALELKGNGVLTITDKAGKLSGIRAKKITIDGITLNMNSTHGCLYAEANYNDPVTEGYETIHIVNGANLDLVSGGSTSVAAKQGIAVQDSTVTAKTTDTQSHALYAWEGPVEIKSSVVNALAESSEAAAVWAGTSVEITGKSQVTAKSDTGSAIYTKGDLNASEESTVNVSGDIALCSGSGDIILTNATINITDTTGTAIWPYYGSISVTGGSVNGGSGDDYTMYSPETVTISDAVLDIQSGEHGIAANGLVKIENVSGTVAVNNAALWSVGEDITLTDCDLTLSGASTVNAGTKDNPAQIQITDSQLDITGGDPLYVAGNMTITDTDLTVTATKRPIVANYGILTIDGAETKIQATGGGYVSGNGVVIKNGDLDIRVTVPESSGDSSMGAIYAYTDGITISGGTVNASIDGKASTRKVALITGGNLNITDGTVTLQGDYPMFISTNGGGSLNFGSNWYQWTESALGAPVLSTDKPYTYVFSKKPYLRIEPVGTTYSLTVERGEGSGSYTAGSTVEISAEPYSGTGHFSEWTVAGTTADIMADSAKAETSITMPAKNVTITANYASHVPGEQGAKTPTCTEEGYTGDKVCKDCGLVLEKGEALPKVSHSYKDGKCTVCGAADPSAQPADPTDPVDPPDSGEQTVSQTGDNSNLTLWLILLSAAGTVAAAAGVYGNKRRKEQ